MKKIKYVKRQGMLDPCLPWVRPGSCRIGVLVGWGVLCLLIGLHFWTQKRVIGASYHRFLVFPMGCRCSVSWWESSRSLWWWAGGTRIHGRFRAVCLFTISCRQRGGVWWCMSRVGNDGEKKALRSALVYDVAKNEWAMQVRWWHCRTPNGRH